MWRKLCRFRRKSTAALKSSERLNILGIYGLFAKKQLQAFDYAREADEKWSGKSDKPPLYGLPFSVKENFHVSLGFVDKFGNLFYSESFQFCV